jgi:hypothetical protein
VKCPHCERPIAIPSQNSDSHALNVDGSTEEISQATGGSASKLSRGLWNQCPECRGAQLKGKVVWLKTTMVCSNCGYHQRTAEIDKAAVHTANIIFWRLLVPAAVIITGISCLIQTRMDGEEFLIFFAFLGICGMITVIGSEFHDLGKGRTFVLCLIAFEVIGVVRNMYGSFIGMHKFEYLMMMMIGMPFLGTMALFGKSVGRSNGSGWSGSSGGGGCGGGGCGGGGGGCGGCGG